MSTIITIHLKKPINSGTEIRNVPVQSGAETREQLLHQTVLSHTRKFSQEDHGKGFKKIAKEFIETNKNNVVKVEGLEEDKK